VRRDCLARRTSSSHRLRTSRNIAISDLMAFKHTATLAAVMAGWILIAPSIDCARRGLEKETPLSEWENVDQFNLQEDCENYRATVVETEKDERETVYTDRYSYALCISEDDPRLKEK
jgi:hypothetical protein